MSPTFEFKCYKERGGCGQTWRERRSIGAKRETLCRCCGIWGRQKHKPSGEYIIDELSMETRFKRSYSQTTRVAKCEECGNSFETYVVEGQPPGNCWECDAGKKVALRVQQIHDIDHQDGRTGDDHYQPAFGTRARSRRDIRELQKRTREEYFKATDGPQTYMMIDRETGEKGKMTVDCKGIDVGEIHTSETPFTGGPDHQKMAETEFRKKVADKVAGKSR